MNVYALVVTKNECNRYLQSALTNLVKQVDNVFVYDDQSSDRTIDIARGLGCEVWTRENDVPSFMEHEGYFRQDSIDKFATVINPLEGDWVLSIDADEFMVSTTDVKKDLYELATQADEVGFKSVVLYRPEIWEVRSEGPYRRIDGAWRTIFCSRLYRFEPNGQINKKPMGCGSEPTYIHKTPMLQHTKTLCMLHYGYVDNDDLKEKYDRYNSLLDHGHNNTHIQSIIAEPVLELWRGPQANVWRGIHE